MVRSTVGLSAAALFAFGCNAVDFAGSNKSNARSDVSRSALSCTAFPESVGLGESVEIAVTASGGYQGPVYQTITSEGLNQKVTLKYSVNNFIQDDGSANIAPSAVAGAYTVELRRSETSADAEFTCSFSVNGAPSGSADSVGDVVDLRNPPLAENQSLSCAVSSGSVLPGQSVSVAVSLASELGDARVFQSVRGPEGKEDILLRRDGNMIREDGSVNAVTMNMPGAYQITYKIEGNEAATTASCDFIVEAPMCQDTSASVGAHVAFVIDNSSSNEATDCPGARPYAVLDGKELHECTAQTNREKAVIKAFDILSAIAVGEPGNSDAVSAFSVSQFPTREDPTNGWKTHAGGWLEARGGNRNSLGDALGFTRRPYGVTPYGSAVDASLGLFGAVAANDGKKRVAVIVTDGEPTDQDPSGVSARADQLRELGVEVITVFVNAGATRAQRESKHISMLNGFDKLRWSETGTHWFSNQFASFGAYIDRLLGRNNQLSLTDSITSKLDAACSDRVGAICQRQYVEVNNSAELEETFRQIIRTKVVSCE